MLTEKGMNIAARILKSKKITVQDVDTFLSKTATKEQKLEVLQKIHEEKLLSRETIVSLLDEINTWAENQAFDAREPMNLQKSTVKKANEKFQNEGPISKTAK